MKKIYLVISIAIIYFMLEGCSQQPPKDETVEISIATLNDNVVKFAIDIRTGIIDSSTIKIIAGDSTGIKAPIDIEVNRENKLFILNQGNGPVPPQVTIFGDTANGNIRPENVINISAGTSLKPIGLAIAENTDFIFVSYFSPDGSVTPKIIKFSISTGIRSSSFDIDSASIGDIELIPSGNEIFAVDALGRRILRLRINISFEIQPGFLTIQGSNTGLQNPNSIALSTDGQIHVFDKYTRTDDGRILIFAPNSSGNVAPSKVIWSYCPGRKTLLSPYGLAVTEQLTAKLILTCSNNKLTTFPADTTGCVDFIQKIDIPAPVAVAFDKVKF